MTGSQQILRDWYRSEYSCVNASANGSRVERYIHEALEAEVPRSRGFGRVLEVGANRGEHQPFVRHPFDIYVASDLVPPQLSADVATDPRVVPLAGDAGALPFASETFDRVIVTCVLHHVPSPYDTVNEVLRVTRVGGVLSVLVPTDPGFTYRWAQRLTTGRAARRRGQGDRIRLVHAIDHRNHFRSIREQMRAALADHAVDRRWLPFRVPSMNLNALTVWTVERGPT